MKMEKFIDKIFEGESTGAVALDKFLNWLPAGLSFLVVLMFTVFVLFPAYALYHILTPKALQDKWNK